LERDLADSVKVTTLDKENAEESACSSMLQVSCSVLLQPIQISVMHAELVKPALFQAQRKKSLGMSLELNCVLPPYTCTHTQTCLHIRGSW